jgi:hypothetical protein
MRSAATRPRDVLLALAGGAIATHVIILVSPPYVERDECLASALADEKLAKVISLDEERRASSTYIAIAERSEIEHAEWAARYSSDLMHDICIRYAKWQQDDADFKQLLQRFDLAHLEAYSYK